LAGIRSLPQPLRRIRRRSGRKRLIGWRMSGWIICLRKWWRRLRILRVGMRKGSIRGSTSSPLLRPLPTHFPFGIYYLPIPQPLPARGGGRNNTMVFVVKVYKK